MSASASQRNFLCISTLLFAASLAVTISWGVSMAEMGAGLPMPGGWTLSMAWMPMCGQGWAAAAASFIGMWSVMMVAMMLPVLTPMLWRYRQVVRDSRPDIRTLLVALGYFAVWIMLGVIVFPLGAILSALVQQEPSLARAVPVVAGVTVAAAGAWQFSAWKLRTLAWCRHVPMQPDAAASSIGSALRHGLGFGLHCSMSCAGLTAMLLAVGVMDLRAMAVVAVAITLERFAPAGERIARCIGVGAVVAGLYLILQSVGGV